ncbi:MAG: hypothetical protein R2845_07110 [Thermomicrobiales bacterium]
MAASDLRGSRGYGTGRGGGSKPAGCGCVVSGAFRLYSQRVEWTTGSSNTSPKRVHLFVVPRPPALSDFRLGYRWEHGPFAPEAVLTWNDYRYRDVTDAAVWPGVTFKPFTSVRSDAGSLLGFDRPLPVDQLGFFLEIEEAIGNQAGPALVWEFLGRWRLAIMTVDDETRRLRRAGHQPDRSRRKPGARSLRRSASLVARPACRR